MANVKLGSKGVGSIVKIKVNGSAQNFIVVHQGLPGSMYDASCNGSWLLMQSIYEKRQWNNRSYLNDYAGSTIHSYLNNQFLNLLDAKVRSAVKQVKIPYRKGNGTSTTVTGGSNGLSAKIFLLSATEVSFSRSGIPSGEGAELAYFKGCADDAGDSKRVGRFSGHPDNWWLRSPYCGNNYTNICVSALGSWLGGNGTDAVGIRPCMILSPSALVDDSGNIIINTAPTVGFSSGADLGEQNEPFSAGYTVSDEDGDALTVTEKLDGAVTATRTGVASGTVLTFGQTATEESFRRILNGSHTLEVAVSDGIESASAKTTFTKAVHKATVTLTEPLAVEGDITVAILQVSGSIPDDAVLKAEATNNGMDDSPVWQDVTTEVQKGTNIVFSNSTATNGAAFNFRISVSRGASGTGGYIESVSGAFQ